MDILLYSIITAALFAIYWFVTTFMPSYFRKKGVNRALKEDARDVEYESEKGRNLATKEDIAEITQKIEEIRSSVSFEEQRRHNILEERKQSFLKVLYCVETIQSLQSMVYYTMFSSSPVDRLYSIISEIQNASLQLVHESRMVMISYPDKDSLKDLLRLIEAASQYAIEICVEASNYASAFAEKERLIAMYQSMPDHSIDFIKKAKESGDKAESIRDNLRYEHAKEVLDRVSDYVVFLSKLYGKEIIVRGK